MNAIEVLRQMHVEAKSGFQRIEQASSTERGSLWMKLRPELVMHEQVEERFVYDPVAQELGSQDSMLSEWHTRHHEDVGEAERMIGEIGRLDPSEDHWLDMVGQLRMTLEKHIQTEEGDIWPRIERMWSRDKLEHAGMQIEQAKKSGSMGEGRAAA